MNSPAPRSLRQQSVASATRQPGRLRPEENFQRAAFVSLKAVRLGGERSRERLCRELYPDDQVTPLLLQQRAAVAGATTGDAAWAGNLATVAVGRRCAASPSFMRRTQSPK